MRAAKPVERLSGMLLDLAIRHDLLVVPVRFVGGLPREEIGVRLEFPFGYGTQDIHIGAPLYAGELAKLPYGERSTVVVSALNALGPEIRQETPNPADPEFARRVQGRMESARMPVVPAAIVEALLEQDDLCDDTREVLAHLRDGTIARSESARRILSLFSVAA